MAQQVSVQLVDDLDGSVVEETVEFGLDGASYAIDLSNGNAEDLRDALARFLENARRTGGRKQQRGRPAAVRPVPSATSREQTRAIRGWARTKGYEVSDRGRIPREIADAYEKAHRGGRAR